MFTFRKRKKKKIVLNRKILRPADPVSLGDHFFPKLCFDKVLSYCTHNQISRLYNLSYNLRVKIRESKFFPIYPNQIETAEEVLNNFRKGIRYAVVTAQTQSGKTGTCQGICYLAQHQFRDLGIKNYYFICGMNDNGLKYQQIREFDGLITPSKILFSKDMQFFSNRPEVKRKNALIKKGKARKEYFRDTIFFCDESHYAQNSLSMVHQFMTRYAGLTMDGDASKWGGSNLYFVSISATPMSEMIHLLEPNQPKVLCRLNPGQGYYGFQRMFELGRVFESKCFAVPQDRTDFVNVLRTLYQKQRSENKYKYAIIRFTNSGHGEQYRQLVRGMVDFPIKYVHFHSESMDIKEINAILKVEPDEFTVIEVFHSLRAGIQMETKNVCLVHETYSAKTDSTVQGLPGRCTGYGKEKDGVIVFCNKDRLKRYVKLIESDFDPALTPEHCTNVKIGYNEKASKKFEACVPMGGRVSDTLIEHLILLKGETTQYTSRFEKEYLDLLKEYDFFDHRVLTNYGFVGVTMLDEKNKTTKTGTWAKFWDPAYKAMEKKRPGSYFRNSDLPDGYEAYYYVYINLKRDHPQFGWVMVTSKKRFDTKSGRYLKTTGSEQFHQKNNKSEEELLGIKKKAKQKNQELLLDMMIKKYENNNESVNENKGDKSKRINQNKKNKRNKQKGNMIELKKQSKAFTFKVRA